MNVYVLIATFDNRLYDSNGDGDYIDNRLYGVFSSLKAAKEAAENHWPVIDEWFQGRWSEFDHIMCWDCLCKESENGVLMPKWWEIHECAIDTIYTGSPDIIQSSNP